MSERKFFGQQDAIADKESVQAVSLDDKRVQYPEYPQMDWVYDFVNEQSATFIFYPYHAYLHCINGLWYATELAVITQLPTAQEKAYATMAEVKEVVRDFYRAKNNG